MQNSFYDNDFYDILDFGTDGNITDSAEESQYFDLGANAPPLHRCMFFLKVVSGTGLATVKVVQATDASGTGKKDVTGASVTASDTLPHLIEVRPNALDLANSFTFIALSLLGDAGGVIVAGFFSAKSRFNFSTMNVAAAQFASVP